MQLISAPQNLTSEWANLGEVIDMTQSTRLGAYLNLDINDSQDTRFRALAKRGKNDTEVYVLPVRTVSASDVKVDDEYIEFNVDADQKMILTLATEGVIPFVQLQVMAGVVGGSPGQIDSAYAELSNY